MRRSSVVFITAIILVLMVKSIAAAALMHSFKAGDVTNGDSPEGSLILSGSTLYGMTEEGGANLEGVIFSIGTDGNNFDLLHTFEEEVAGNGSKPKGSLILSGSTLYGMTYQGGKAGVGEEGDGVIFSIGTDGNNFDLLHTFTGGNGSKPRGSLLLDGSTLYGMTEEGGANLEGVIFSIETDKTGFTLLHTFEEEVADNGSNPYGNLILGGSTLYGMTYHGGKAGVGEEGDGVIFSIETDKTGFQILRTFVKNTVDNGDNPEGSLILSGSTLFGLAKYGGVSDLGVIFSIETDGDLFQILHSFAGRTGDGDGPKGDLILDGSTLYGMTYRGGANNTPGDGVVFSKSLIAPTLATTTPTSYDCSVTKVEMHNGTSWITIFTGTAALDVVPGGTFPGVSDKTLPAGTYSQIRVTFTNAFPLQGSRSYGGTTYYTTAATFGGQINLASTPTTTAGAIAEFTFRIEAWGAINTEMPQTFAITPITVGPLTDYQPTLRFTISDKLELKGTDGTTPTYYFSLSAPTVTIVEP